MARGSQVNLQNPLGIKSERPFRFRVSGILSLFLIAEEKFCRQF
jgi:hypothetical protein